MACCSPDGRAVLNHGGSRSRFGFGRAAGGDRSAIGSGLPDIRAHPPLEPPTPCLIKKVRRRGSVTPIQLSVFSGASISVLAGERALMSNERQAGLWRTVLLL